MPDSETREKTVPEFAFGQSLLSMIGGAAAILLAITGLINVDPILMASFGALAIGITFLLEGVVIAREFNQIVSQIAPDKLHKTELRGGMSAELLAGCVGVLLGFLSAIGVNPFVLTSIAIIFFGCALLVGSSILTRLNTLKINTSVMSEHAQKLATEFVSLATGVQVLTGIVATILGILGLIGIQPLVLTLTALLAIGTTVLLSGIAINKKSIKMIRH